MEERRITGLCQQLTLEFERDGKGPRVAALLSEYSSREPDWRRFAFFDEECYTRNLVFKDGIYELLILCWGKGQESPIHNHMGQSCWMAVLDGWIEEVQYTQLPGSQPGPLIQKCIRAFDKGQVAYIDDDIALHLVRPIKGTSGVSLHLYSRPYDVCKVYDRDSGTVIQKQLAYHSIHGEPCPRPGSTLSSRARDSAPHGRSPSA